MGPYTISGVNRLPDAEKRAIYQSLIPRQLTERFAVRPDWKTADGRDLIELNALPGSSTTEMAVRHQAGFPDPVLYGHITDSVTGQVHVLLYVLNDPESPRFDTDRLPDGTPTRFGTCCRNIPAELGAMQAGLAPGQIRRGLRLLWPTIEAFENFVRRLGQTIYFAEPLYYHNAIIFEHYGFAYQSGRKMMERIQAGFSPTGDLLRSLDCSTPFRHPAAAGSIRLRSWAIHDGLLGEPFDRVTMYKHVGKSAAVDTSQLCCW